MMSDMFVVGNGKRGRYCEKYWVVDGQLGELRDGRKEVGS